MKKTVLTVLTVLSALMLILCFAACGDNTETDGGVKNYTMETEYINLDGMLGSAHSAETAGVNMIIGEGTDEEKARGWSNGYYVGYTYAANLTFNFVFTSDAAETAAITLRLGSEIGDITLGPSEMSVKLNGTEISYNRIFIEGSTVEDLKFWDKTLTTDARLTAGENTLSVTMLDNKLFGGQMGGPMFDCVKIKTKATLNWTDKTGNPDGRGSI